MPWQRLVADVALEIDPYTGLLAYREIDLTVPRQSGKTTLILSVSVQRALGWLRQRIVYAAQTRNDARKKWEDDHVITLESSDFAALFRTRKTNGNEAVLWKNGSQHGITSNTEKAGHGGTIDLGFIDEAFAQVDNRLEQAYKPAMITRPQPQLWVVSTAGTPDSVYLREKVDTGRARLLAGEPSKVAYFEWSAPEDADPADRAVWRACMPALGYTISEDAIAADFQTMNLLEFRRAYLNQWCDRNVHEPVVDLQVWADLRDDGSTALDPVYFALDATPDRSWASIMTSGLRTDGRLHGELIDHRPGMGWLLDRVVQLDGRWHPAGWLLDPAGPCGSLIPALQEAGIEPILVNAREMGQACGAFYDAAVNDRIRYVNHPDLNAALAGAKKRDLGDAWAWHRKDSVTDISPLVGLTLAMHGVATREPPTPPPATTNTAATKDTYNVFRPTERLSI
jgi:hypothetical protein